MSQKDNNKAVDTRLVAGHIQKLLHEGYRINEAVTLAYNHAAKYGKVEQPKSRPKS